jgi:hypothetical protein
MDRLRDRWYELLSRLRRLERRELAEFRAWLETTRNLVHLTGVVAVPLLVAAVTGVSNAVAVVPFVLFPPLASGTFTLFSEPEGRYADPRTFVAGLTAGALCGCVAAYAAVVTGLVEATGPMLDRVSPLAAAAAVFLTGTSTWALDVEEPAAFSTALLAMLVPATPAGYPETLVAYVGFTTLASAGVAAAFWLWRERLYERRSDVLYRSTERGERILVPVRGVHDRATATLAAALADEGETGAVVLLDVVETESAAAAERDRLSGGGSGNDAATTPDMVCEDGDPSAESVSPAAATAARLEALADSVEARTGVSCEVVVATGESGSAVVGAAHETNCDLIVTPYETADGRLSPFVGDLFRGDVDVLVHRANDPDATAWRDVLVPVRRASDVAHEMVEFAVRLAGGDRVTLATCIGESGDRRRAESMLADLAETVPGVETRVSRREIEPFLDRTAPSFDLVIVGASRDRSAASRFVSPPTFERIGDLDTDVAVLDRNVRY